MLSLECTEMPTLQKINNPTIINNIMIINYLYICLMCVEHKGTTTLILSATLDCIMKANYLDSLITYFHFHEI